MFQNLANKLDQTLKNLRGLGRITEENIKSTLREVRISLLEADVALPVITHFLETVKSEVMGQKVMNSLSPGQAFIKVIKETLVLTLGSENAAIHFNATPPMIILLAGLQGSGKTTTAAKLAKWLQDKHKKSVMLASTDVYRPAAMEQLKTLAAQIDCPYFEASSNDKPLNIANHALAAAKKAVCDILIIDTAGRLHVDHDMMQEITALHQSTQPTETLFVVDSMTGQDAANTAKQFNEALALTGVILTKVDGDARGGAALSIRHITEKPIKFMGVGEKIDAFEPFHPDRIASRILGMGDVLSLIEEAEQLDQSKGKKLVKKIRKGGGFDLEDFRDQLKQMGKLGGVAGIMKKLPGMGQMGKLANGNIEGQLKGIQAIIDSMTPKERHFPALIKGSRKQRIAKGSGRTVQEVNKMLKQFEQMQKMMKKLSAKGGMKKMMRGLGGMGGMPQMPGGLGDLGAGGMPDLSQLGGMMPPGMDGLDALLKKGNSSKQD